MLEIENLSVDYFRRGKLVHAVRNVSLSMEAGQTLGIVGESGSGKSTVALAILRLIRPQEGRITSGRIFFDGINLLELSEAHMRTVRGKKISMIFQDPFTSLNPVMRIREQMFEGFPAGVSLEERCQEVLQQVQLDPKRVLDAYPHQLSGGQRQRVMIAMALLGNPRLLLADEPTTALDTLVQKDILDLLFRLQKQLGLGILFISHHLSLVAHYTQKLVIMKEGQEAESGKTLDVLRHPTHPYTKELWASVPRLKR